MRPRSCDSVTDASGISARRISAARSSMVGSSGEKMLLTATQAMPAAFISRAAAATARSSSGMIGRPS